MIEWHHQLNRHEFEQTPGDSERQGSLVGCSPWGFKVSDMTEWRNNVSIESVMSSNHLILCYPLLLPSIFFSIGVFFFSVSQLFSSGGKSIGASASASVLPMNIHDWFPVGMPALISLQGTLSKGLSSIFSNTTVQKHQLFGAQLSSQSDSHIHTWPLEKKQPWLDRPLLAK